MYALNVTKTFRGANNPVDDVRYLWVRQGDDGTRTALPLEVLTAVELINALDEL